MMGFKETEIGSLPQDWDLGNLGQYFEIRQGKQVSAKTRQGDNIKHFLRTANVFWGKIDLTKLDKMHFSNDETKGLTLKENDLLVCEGGEIGRTAIWRNNIADCYYQNHIHRLRPKDTSIFPEFYLYWLRYGFLVGKHYIGIGNKTTIPNLSQSRLKLLLVPHPSVSEQQNIACILSRIQSAIEVQERIIKTSMELKKTLMQKLFTEGLRGEKQKQTEIGLVPESWETKRIDAVYTFTHKPRGLDLSRTKQVPFIPMELMPNDSLFAKEFEFRETDALSSGTYIENGDLLIAKITPCFENGKQAIVDFGHQFGYATTEVIPIKEIDKISSKAYLFYYLLKDDVRSRLAGKMEGATGRQRLGKNVLGETLIPFPTNEEQLEITNIFIGLDKKIEFTRKKKQILQELFKSMLQQLMTGQIRVKNVKVA